MATSQVTQAERDELLLGAWSYQEASDRVLADVDTFADHLGGACMGKSKVTSERETRIPGRLLQADDAVVLHAGLVAGQRGDSATALEVLRILGDRYLQRSCERVARVASELLS